MSTAVLGIDYGEKRIGIARASRVARLPEPLLTITNSGDVTTKIKQLASEEDATTLVVGLPRSLEGVDTEQTIDSRSKFRGIFGGDRTWISGTVAKRTCR